MTPADAKSSEVFSDEEKLAMKDRAKELKRPARKGKVDGLTDLLEKISEMSDDDRALAERVHAIVTETAPDLAPKTWYGQPAWAKAGKVVVFFQASGKFGTRYSTLGFSEDAQLDEGTMWPTSFALAKLTKADEKAIADLVKRAAG